MFRSVLFKIGVSAIVFSLALPAASQHGFADSQKKEGYSSYYIENAGFEDSESLAGWKETFGKGAFAVDPAKSSEGKQSLKVEDRLDGQSAGLSSSQASVTPGQYYRFDADLSLEKGTLSLYLLYLDHQGKEIGRFTETVKASNMPTGEWMKGSVSGKAPHGAVSAELLIYSGVSSVTTANVDNVHFSWEPQLDLKVGESVDLGEAVKASLNSSAAFSSSENGRSEIYFAVNGVPATFYAIDGETGEKIFSQAIPRTDTIWATTVGSDGNVYFAGTEDGILYRYLPHEKRIENLGKNPSDNWVWDLEMSEDGKVYGATYPNAKVFEFDINTGTFADLGTFKEGQKYARGLGLSGDYLYVGIGTTAYVTRMNLKTGEKEEVKIPISGQNNSIANIEAYGGKLFIRAGGSTLYVLDEGTLEHINTIKYKGEISPPSPKNGDDMYYIFGSDLYRYSLTENRSVKIEGLPDLDYTTRKLDWIKAGSGYVLGIVTGFSEYLQYNPDKNEVTAIFPEIEPQGVPVQSLEKGFDGRLYLGGYHRGMSIFDMDKEEITHNLSWMPQPEGMGFLNGKVYFGTYGGAKIYQYDPEKPLDFGESPSHNPGLAYDIEEFQDRPFTFASGDNKLFIGTIPGYGELGGALTVYDEGSGEWSVTRNLVKNQSIVGLAFKDGLLFGGTSVWGGGGSDPESQEAKVFVWDAVKGEKVAEFTPDIPGIDTPPKMIGELSFGPDGLLWGAVDGTIFAMDPATYQVVKSKLIYPSTYAASKWRPIFLRWGTDGLLYTTLGRKLTVLDPDSMAHVKVMDNVHLMDIGDDGYVYYASGSHLFKLAISRSRINIERLQELIDHYRQEGDIQEALYRQLSNDFTQAAYFVNAGSKEKAAQFIEKAIGEVRKDSSEKLLSEDAKTVLLASLKLVSY